MDSRWRNLGIFLGVLFVLAIGYFYLLPQPAFQSRLDEMQKSWQQYGMDEPLHLEYDKLNSLNEVELSEVKANLLAFNESESVKPAKELGEAYVSLVDVSLYRKKMLAQQASLSDSQSPCELLAEYELLTDYKQKLLSSTKEYIAKVDSFVSNNPEEAIEVEISPGGNAEELEQSVNEHEELMEILREVCK